MGCLFSKNAWVSDLLHTSAPFRLRTLPSTYVVGSKTLKSFISRLQEIGCSLWEIFGDASAFRVFGHSSLHWYRNGVKEKSVYAFIENGQKRYWYWTERTGWVNVSGLLRQWRSFKVLRRVVPDDLARLVIEYGDHP